MQESKRDNGVKLILKHAHEWVRTQPINGICTGITIISQSQDIYTLIALVCFNGICTLQ